MKEALLIIDVQNYYFPGGANALYNPYEAEKRIQELISESRTVRRPIVYIQHINPPDDTFFLEGTPGVEISDRIKPEAGDKVIIKRYGSLPPCGRDRNDGTAVCFIYDGSSRYSRHRKSHFCGLAGSDQKIST